VPAYYRNLIHPVVNLSAEEATADVLVAGAGTPHETVSRFLATGRSVVFLEAERGTLARHSPFGPRELGRVLALRRGRDRYGRPEFFVYHWPPGPAASDLEELQFQRGLQKHLQGSGSSDDEPAAPPAGLIYAVYNYSATAPSLAFTLSAGGATRHSQPQRTSLEVNYTVRLYLENSDVATGDRQWVVFQTDINSSPLNPGAGSTSLLTLKDGKDGRDSDLGWFQTSVLTTTQPDNPDDGTFQVQQTSPMNTNGVSEVSTSLSFGINFTSLEGGGGANYNYSQSVTRDIQDWGVRNVGGGAVGSWKYLCQDPYEAEDPGRWGRHGTGGGLEGSVSSVARKPNNLSSGEFEARTQVVWTTSGVVDAVRTFGSTVATTFANAYSETISNGVDQQTTYHHTLTSVPLPAELSVDLSSVLPVPIASVTFDPPVARPKENPIVVGTVTLASPARLDTPVQITSNSENATVLGQTIVPQGQTTGVFNVTTNTNNLRSGEETTATITAFYAQGLQVQLTVRN